MTRNVFFALSLAGLLSSAPTLSGCQADALPGPRPENTPPVFVFDDPAPTPTAPAEPEPAADPTPVEPKPEVKPETIPAFVVLRHTAETGTEGWAEVTATSKPGLMKVVIDRDAKYGREQFIPLAQGDSIDVTNMDVGDGGIVVYVVVDRDCAGLELRPSGSNCSDGANAIDPALTALLPPAKGKQRSITLVFTPYARAVTLKL